MYIRIAIMEKNKGTFPQTTKSKTIEKHYC